MARRRSRLSEFFDRARKNRGRHFLSFYQIERCSPENPEPIEWFVLASKKGVDKRAVRRNRARRRIRSAVEAMNLGLVPEGWRVKWVIMAGRAAVEGSWEDLCVELNAHWTSIQSRAVEFAGSSPC